MTDAAKQLGIARQTLHRILAERAAVTPEMAVRLGKLCGDGPGLWLRLQQTSDLWHAEEQPIGVDGCTGGQAGSRGSYAISIARQAASRRLAPHR